MTDHHFFEKLVTTGKMAFYNFGSDLGILLRLLEYRLMYQALSNFETATDKIDKIRTFISES